MQSNKKFITSVVLIVGINLIGIVGWWLAFSYTQEKRNNILAVRQKTALGDERLGNVRSSRALLENIKKEKEKIAAAFVESENIIGLIKEFESLGQRAGVGLKINAVNLPTARSDTQKPTFEFRAEGLFRDLFQYLVSLENLPYQINFKEIQLNTALSAPSEKKENKGFWQADFKINLLSYEI